LELLSRINFLSDPKNLRAGATLMLSMGLFHAVVNKREFTMDVYVGAAPGEKGSMYVTTFPVGLGKDDSTPTGVWLVEPHKKIKNPTYFSPRGEGVVDADDPKNPLGEFWIGLTGIDGHAVGKASYGIHGTIEPDSIGKQASMGCVRMRNEDVARVFELLVEGKSQVVVKE
jgi:lipoprotein-anchoring transpeptidase ErfK/SrfK